MAPDTSHQRRISNLLAVFGFGILFILRSNVQPLLSASNPCSLELAHDHMSPLPPESSNGRNGLALETLTENKTTECNSICDCFQKALLSNTTTPTASSYFTTSSLWNLHSSRILEASLLLEEAVGKEVEYREWVRHLFALSTTNRLRKSVDTLPDFESLETLHQILQQRWKDPDHNPPLKVAIFGGSLTAGHGCLANPIGLPDASFLKPKLQCAWPARVQHILNQLLQTSSNNNNNNTTLVEVHNMAMAATTSDVGATVVEYELWPEQLRPHGPDVILAAFSTNDAHAPVSQDEIFQNMQLLAESVHRLRHCRRPQQKPILVFADDFIAWPGPVQHWLTFRQNLLQLAEWHNLMTFSFANAFRDYVHADLTDVSFKGRWWKEEGRRNVTKSDPHPGMSFNIVMAWVVVFNMLHVALETCGDLKDKQQQQLPRVALLSDNFPVSTMPDGPRPPLTPDLLTEDIPSKWQASVEERESHCLMEAKQTGPRCSFVWVANRVSEYRTAKAIEAKLKTVMTNNDGWNAEGDSYRSKHGWVAKKANATFQLEIANLETDIKFLTVLSLKSYGDAWDDSKLRMSVLGSDGLPTTSFELEGFHNSTTSVIIPHKFDLEEMFVARGETLHLLFELIGGTTFKVSGMAFCSR